MKDPWDDVQKAGDWLLELERSFQPDLVHVNGYAHGALPWKAPVLVVAHSCVLSWWQAVNDGSAPASKWGIYRERATAGLHAADYVVAPSEFMLREVRRLYGRSSNLCVIPNGTNPALFQGAAKKEAFVVSAGRLWDEAKNIGALDRIADYVHWPICIAGNASAPDGKSTVSHPRICRSVGRLEPQAFAEFLGRAAIFCLPARYEPFGLSMLEAALSGCALVLGDIPSLRQTWEGAAVFVDPRDDRSLAGALNNLIHDPRERTDLAQRGHERGQSFTAERMAAKYFDVYKMLLGRRQYSGEARASACAS
jgi:glycosyltransferase involved in cell wall biosynthesis